MVPQLAPYQGDEMRLIHGLAMLLVSLPCRSDLPLVGPINGRVIDYATGDPIEGAILVAVWEGSVVSLYAATTICVDVKTTTSDERGAYHFDPWVGPSIAVSVYPHIVAYKAGYWPTSARLHYVGRPGAEGTSRVWIVYDRADPETVLQTFADERSASDATHPADRFMQLGTYTPDQRFEYLAVGAGAGCQGIGGIGSEAATRSLRNFYSLYKALYKEAKQLAHTPEQLRRLPLMQDRAADMWLAGEGNSAYQGDPLTKVPKEICMELDGHERQGPLIVITALKRGQPDQVTTRRAGEPPC
jgi:hypothetical protein